MNSRECHLFDGPESILAVTSDPIQRVRPGEVLRRSSYPIGVAVEATTGTATRRRGTPGRAIRYAADRAFRAAGVDRSTTFEVNGIVAAAEPVRKRPGRPRHARADRGPLPRSSPVPLQPPRPASEGHGGTAARQAGGRRAAAAHRLMPGRRGRLRPRGVYVLPPARRPGAGCPARGRSRPTPAGRRGPHRRERSPHGPALVLARRGRRGPGDGAVSGPAPGGVFLRGIAHFVGIPAGPAQ